MNENAVVVVFPSSFSKNKQNQMISNIKKILRVQNQKFNQITKDDDLIIIDANDPVFASTTVNLLFGVDKVAIAKQVENKFDELVSSIAKIGVNQLLKGDQFYIKVEGHSSGYLPKDVEIAATSALVEKTAEMECKPGTEQKHDKLIYCFLTKSKAYVTIFLDRGHGGIPYNSQGERIVCAIHDELSAVSCLETIKQGFDVKVVVCYVDDSNLLELVKMVNRIIPRLLRSKITIDFFMLNAGKKELLEQKIKVVTQIQCAVAKKEKIGRISLSLSPLLFPLWFIDQNTGFVLQNKLTPWITLAGIDDSIMTTAKEIGLGKYLQKIDRLSNQKFSRSKFEQNMAKKVLATKQTVTVSVGPNNVHDILDSLKH